MAESEILDRLFQVIESRRLERPDGSYVVSLLDGGLEAVAAKIREEAEETIEAAESGDAEHCAREVADLLFHLWVLLSLVLWPLYGKKPGPGPFERRCLARALRVPPPKHEVSMTRVETVTVNGGKDTLRGTLWLPALPSSRGPFPTVVLRNPYGGGDRTELGQGLLAERGYAVLVQDTRGRFGSDGQFVPVENEREDGAATVEWIKTQPWCDTATPRRHATPPRDTATRHRRATPPRDTAT